MRYQAFWDSTYTGCELCNGLAIQQTSTRHNRVARVRGNAHMHGKVLGHANVRQANYVGEAYAHIVYERATFTFSFRN